MMVDGTYKISMKTPMGTQYGTVTLESKGTVLSGSVTTPFGVSPFSGGTVNGQEAKWSASSKSPFGVMKFDFTATVDGSKISGSVKTRVGSIKFEGTRVGDAATRQGT